MPKAKAAAPVSWSEKQGHIRAVRECLDSADTLVAFCDGSSLRNPGPAGAAALFVLPIPSLTRSTAAQDSTLNIPTLLSARPVHPNNGTNAKTAGSINPNSASTGNARVPEVRDEDRKTISSRFVAPNIMTNNQMEIKGVDLALDLLERYAERWPGRNKWVVMTDSDYLVGLLERGNYARMNTDIIQALRYRIGDIGSRLGVQIRAQWVRSHCGIYFNEAVDQLSKAAAKECERNIRSQGVWPPKMVVTGPSASAKHVNSRQPNEAKAAATPVRNRPAVNGKPSGIRLNYIRGSQIKAQARAAARAKTSTTSACTTSADQTANPGVAAPQVPPQVPSSQMPPQPSAQWIERPPVAAVNSAFNKRSRQPHDSDRPITRPRND
jgi:ribonuclease HI